MKRLALALVLPQVAGLIGSLFTFPAIESWYGGLNQPSFSPPNWLFGPVWTTLYLLMGIAWYLAWKKGVKPWLFLGHLGLNSLWSILFFGLRNPGLAFAEILILWWVIVLVIRQFRAKDCRTGWLLAPYLAWVSFAAFLNFSIWQLNK